MSKVVILSFTFISLHSIFSTSRYPHFDELDTGDIFDEIFGK